jgi:hypothetical protein
METSREGLPSIAQLQRRHVGAFEDLKREMSRLLARDEGDVGTSAWLSDQSREATKAVGRASLAVLGPGGDAGVAVELVEAGFTAGLLLGEKAAELAGLPVQSVGQEGPHSPSQSRLIRRFLSDTQEVLETALTKHRDACEHIRRATMVGRSDGDSDEWDIVAIAWGRVRRVLYDAVHMTYLDRLVACGVDVMYITGYAPECPTCVCAVHQRLFSISGTDPTLPPLALVTVYAIPPLWYDGCKHPGVPYNQNGPVSVDEIEESLRQCAYELEVGALIFGVRHPAKGTREPETDQGEE